MNPTFTAARSDERKIISHLIATGNFPPEGLLPDMLQETDHAAIIAAMNRLRDDGEDCSTSNITRRLIAVRGETTSFGQTWSAYLDELANNAPYTADLSGCMMMICRASMLRHQIEQAQQVIESLAAGDEEQAAEEINRLTEMMGATSTELIGIPADELVANFPTLRPSIIDGILRRGETCNIIAASKVGKSWLSLCLALSVANSMKWLGRFWTTQGRVLLIDNELHKETISHRLKTVADAMGVKLNDQVCVESLRGKLSDLGSVGRRLSQLKPGSFSLIVLDAWYRFQPKGSDENSNADVVQLYNLIDQVASKIDAAFVCVHHSSKGDQSGKSVTDVGSGAGAQSRAADTHLIIRPHEEQGAVVVDAATRSFKPIEPFAMRWQFPLWHVDEELDPTKLKPLRPSREDQKAERDEKRKLEDREKVIKAYRQFPSGETKNVLKDAAGLSGGRFSPINLALIEEGILIPCEIKKGHCSYHAYRLNPDEVGQLGQLGQGRTVRGGPDSSDNPSLEGCPATTTSVRSEVDHELAGELFPVGGSPA